MASTPITPVSSLSETQDSQVNLEKKPSQPSKAYCSCPCAFCIALADCFCKPVDWSEPSIARTVAGCNCF